MLDGTFPKFTGFIPHLHLVKSPLIVFGKGRQSLEGDWTNLPMTFIQTSQMFHCQFSLIATAGGF